jgi:hypothetical protein
MKKIQLLAIFMLLIVPLSGVIGTANITTQPSSPTQFEDQVTIQLKAAPLFTGVNLEITNTGNTTLTNIPWYFKTKPVITGTGLIRKTLINQGTIPELTAGETTTIEFRPF